MMNNTDPFPIQFLERLEKMYGAEEKETILQSFCTEKFPSIRVNTLKISIEEFVQNCKSLNIELEHINWYNAAFSVKNKTTRELTETELYKQGAFYIQSLSSMIPALVLAPQQDEKILDIAAAPGSKTTQLAAIMNNTGEILANDTSRVRIYKLEENLKNLDVTNTRVRIGLGEKVWQDYPEYFDKTLVDVPCSMEGRFNCHDKKSYEHWSQKKVKQIAKQQQWLLRSAISATKPGGIIVYSTCTLSPEENEGVINWILEKEEKTVILEEISIEIPDRATAISKWNATIFHTDIQKTMRINPTNRMEGFYIAKLRKIASNVKL